MPYTIDAAFSDSERAIIASGFSQVQNNSCVRFDFHAYSQLDIFVLYADLFFGRVKLTLLT